MSLALLHSRALCGLAALPVTVEVHLAPGLPSFTLVGLADTEVKEARERVRAALTSSGLQFPHDRRITVNLAPADLPKEGARFDLPIALGLLVASGQLPASGLDQLEWAGELSLSGELRPVRGALAQALALRREGASRGLVLPAASAQEAAWVEGVRLHVAQDLLGLVAALQDGSLPTLPRQARPAPLELPLDLRDVRGQAGPKRALEVAAAGAHHLLLVGPPGTGKSMLAQRLPGLLPPLPLEAALEVAALQSLVGSFAAETFAQRPFRCPHHSASAVALVGGASPPRPGEISLAHHGVLFLDELPEFPRAALEALREPLETGRIHIARAARSSEFPARFQLVAAMNPCPCGHLGNPLKACRCSPEQVSRYQGRLSGPLLDRLDLLVEVPLLHPTELAAAPDGEGSAEVAARVAEAQALALERQGCLNAQLPVGQLERFAPLQAAAAQLLQQAAQRLAWSGRALHRVQRVARTLADLGRRPQIEASDIAQAIQMHRALPR
ncbi:magnesium chelatase family protein [Inhella inkyongensis]|uniref:Magnesium chelatase family protein n=1 Tax=Inhella inkyongensis TaxID=392593 RepID=A0A840SBJ3_9BURK|nr:YifB family Mg chelatase-like AAA ATPase [Inhella inkyongensis]MBB5205719.1 magnesium chelatase family protein [Inhella inkyongensis]